MPKNACKSPLTMFFVEGDMEQQALRRHFNIRAKKIGLFGDKVATEAIARNIATTLLIAGDVKRVFIMFDRESRRESCAKIAGDLRNALSMDFPDMEILIAIPDRDIEVWLFSDCEATSQTLKVRLGPKSSFEGRKGVERLSIYVGSGKYEKMKHGVKLMSKARWSEIRKKSASARMCRLEEFFVGCDKIP